MGWVSNGAAHDLSKTTNLTMKRRYIPNTPTAREKLNSAHLIAAFVVASIIGAMTGSWLAFVVTAGIFIAVAINSGDIRLKGRR